MEKQQPVLTTTRSREWTLTTDAAGRIVNLATTEHAIYGGTKVAAKVMALLNRDLADGVSSPDLSTWGYECPENGLGGSVIWYSNLNFAWNWVADTEARDGVPDEDRRRSFVRALRETVEHGIAHNWPDTRMHR